MFFALTGLPETGGGFSVPDDLWRDWQDYQTAKLFEGVNEWEVDDVPVYWIERKQMFNRVFDEAMAQLRRQEEAKRGK